MNTVKKTFFSIILFVASTTAFSGIRNGSNLHKDKAGYYFHVCIHDNGVTGSRNGYPLHSYNVYTFITAAPAANLSQALPVSEALICNASFSVLSDGSMGSKTVAKRYVIDAGSGYCLATTKAGSNLKMTISSVTLSTYLYNGNTIHIDYTVHNF